MLAALLLSLALFTPSAHAEDWTVHQTNSVHYVQLEHESGHYRLSHFVAAEGELQEKLEERVFDELSSARLEARAWLRKLGRRIDRPDPAPTLPPEGIGTQPSYITEVPGQSLWTATQTWSPQWEAKFSRWVHDEIDTDFFLRYNIATDCADVEIGLRWIFSRMHSLPIGNTLAGSGRLLTHDSMRKAWLGLARGPEWFNDPLFLKALDYVLDNTYTRTLLWDGYPITIGPQTFTAGLFHLEFHSAGGHTMVLKELEPGSGWSAGSLKLIQSTLPRDVRALFVTDFVSAAQPQRADGGFMRQRWLVKSGGTWALAQENKHRDYSAEQYAPEFMNGNSNFSTAIKTRLMAAVDDFEEFRQGLVALWTQIESRIKTVEDGYAACLQTDCAPGSRGWDEYSTPTRDGKITDKIKFVEGAVKDHPGDQRILEAWRTFETYELEVAGQTPTLRRVMDNFVQRRTSADPRQTPARRWGL